MSLLLRQIIATAAISMYCTRLAIFFIENSNDIETTNTKSIDSLELKRNNAITFDSAGTLVTKMYTDEEADSLFKATDKNYHVRDSTRQKLSNKNQP